MKEPIKSIQISTLYLERNMAHVNGLSLYVPEDAAKESLAYRLYSLLCEINDAQQVVDSPVVVVVSMVHFGS